MRPDSKAPFAFLSRHRFMIALMMAAGCEQAVITIVRVVTSYRAIEFALPVVLIGIITASYAVTPVFLGVKVGRYVDRGFDARISWIGAALLAVASFELIAATAWWSLMAGNILLGLGHMCLYIGLQVMCTRDESPGALVRMFGNFMVANALGQALGSGIIAWFGGGEAIPPAQLLFAISGLIALLSMLATLTIAPHTRAQQEATRSGPISLMSIARTPGFFALIVVAAIGGLSQDLLVVFLPLLGAERGIAVEDVGAMLALRAVASVVARLVFARLHAMFGAGLLLIVTSLIGGAGYLVLALPVPLWAMYAGTAIGGFAIGISSAVAIATSMELIAPPGRGTATSLRMILNRFSQAAIPFLLSLVATAVGAASIFAVIGAALLASAAAGRARKPAEP